MKIVILGAGAMGCLYGAGLVKAGQQVTLIAARKAHIDALNERGLTVEAADGTVQYRIPAMAAADYSGIADAILVFTKGADSKAALESFRHGIGPDTLLISLQNGPGHETLLSDYADPDRVVIGTTNFPSDRVDASTIRIGGTGVTRLMTASGNKSERFDALVTALALGGLKPEPTEAIRAAIWEKTAFNAALNSLTAVTLMPQGHLAKSEEGPELIRTIVHEVCMTANRKGIPADEAAVTETALRLLTEHSGHCPSMLQDVLGKRATEIEYISGAVVREAKALGLEVPVTETLYRLICILQRNYANRLL